MAFLQSNVPPSSAVVSLVQGSRPRVAALPARGGAHGVQTVAAVLAAILLAMVGVLAARETESIAMGIIAADFLFLVVVAAWSMVVNSARH